MSACPLCGESLKFDLRTVHHRGRPAAVMGPITWCTGCPAVSEVSMPTGLLVDLGNITVEDLEEYEPYIQSLMFTATPLHGRRDS